MPRILMNGNKFFSFSIAKFMYFTKKVFSYSWKVIKKEKEVVVGKLISNVWLFNKKYQKNII